MAAIDSGTKKISAKLVTMNRRGIVFELIVPKVLTAGQLSAILTDRWNKFKEATSDNPSDRCTGMMLYKVGGDLQAYADTDSLTDYPDDSGIMFVPQ